MTPGHNHVSGLLWAGDQILWEKAAMKKIMIWQMRQFSKCAWLVHACTHVHARVAVLCMHACTCSCTCMRARTCHAHPDICPICLIILYFLHSAINSKYLGNQLQKSKYKKNRNSRQSEEHWLYVLWICHYLILI